MAGVWGGRKGGVQVLQPREEREDCARLICMCKHAPGDANDLALLWDFVFLLYGKPSLAGEGGELSFQ